MRGLPAVHRFLERPEIAAYEPLMGRETLKRSIAAELERVRAAEAPPPFELMVASTVERIEREAAETLVPVINATGILLHTNLGRAPLSAGAFMAAREVAEGYSNIEYDLNAGVRSSRHTRLTALLRELTGAQDALVVNNCAAAVLLILDTFAREREVIVARGQLIEIGGGFRLPEVLERSGARMVEVGTTNKVYIEDYERALSPATALLLRTHPSNFKIEGFTHDTGGDELAALGRRAGVVVAEDLGSGALADLTSYGLPRERTVGDAVRDGIDLVAFSGDKLLGGPQAGIIVGTAPLIARLRSNPLVRALRPDKVTLALLAGTLRAHLTPQSRRSIPFCRMLEAGLDELRVRGERYIAAIASARIIEHAAQVGGGALPEVQLPSIAIALKTPHPDALDERLRRSRQPIIGCIEDGALVLDLRTILPAQDDAVIAALRAIAA